MVPCVDASNKAAISGSQLAAERLPLGGQPPEASRLSPFASRSRSVSGGLGALFGAARTPAYHKKSKKRI
jgi:hypothetical protein